MSRFNWKHQWWCKGMSLLAFAYRFATANALTGSEFCTRLRHASINGERKASELIWPDKSALSLEGLVDEVTRGTHRPLTLFASSHTITGRPEEVSTSLRFCHECLAAGQHFAWQQLVWLDTCPIHQRPLQCECTCGRRIPYRLIQRRLTLRYLCSCGKLRFDNRSGFSNNLLYALNNFDLRIRMVRELFGPDFRYLRMRYDPPDAQEMQAAFRLTQNALRAAIEHDGGKVHAVALRELEYHDQVSGHRRWLHSKFEKFFDNPRPSRREERETAAQSVGRLQAAWNYGEISNELSHWLSAAPGRAIPGQLHQFVEVLFVYRALDALRRGRTRLDSYRGEVAYRVSRCVPNPVCLVTSAEPSTGSTSKAIWLRNNDYWEPSRFPWIDSLSRFLVMTCYRRSSSSSVAKRLLGAMGLPRRSPDRRQLDLFGDFLPYSARQHDRW